MIAVSSARAWSSVAPSARRPITESGSSADSARRRRRTRAGATLPRPSESGNRAGATPTTSYARRRSRTVLPTIDGSAREAAGPQPVAEHDAMPAARLRFVVQKLATEDRRHAKHLEKTRRDRKGRHLLRRVDTGQVGVPPLPRGKSATVFDCCSATRESRPARPIPIEETARRAGLVATINRRSTSGNR